MNDKVSVVMPCYNSEKYISKAIESVLQQTYGNLELIIVDDGSVDESLKVIKQYVQKDSRIKVFVNKENEGVGRARNIALQHCSGKYIAFLDADDVAKNNRLEKEIFFLEKNRTYGAVGGQAQIIDEDNHIVDTIHCPLAWQDIKKSILFRNPFVNSSMMVRKCILDKYHISFNENLNMGEDYLFWISISKHCRIKILEDYLILYRRNMSGLSHRWCAEMDSNGRCSKEHEYIYRVLWKQRGINVDSCNIDSLINALVLKKTKDIFESFRNIESIIKYGLSICKCRYDKIIFREMNGCIKKIYNERKGQYKCYKNQFRGMRKSVQKYGNYPYPKYMVLTDKKLIYLEMPKVANCSIKASMLKEKFDDDYSVQNESLKYTVHNLGKRYDDYYKFTFVRNPLERVVSCYESKFHKDRQMIGHVVKELEYDYYLFGYIRKDRGFSNFLCRIALIPDRYKDHHFKPQYKIVFDDNGKQRVDFIGRYENLGQEYQRISREYDLDELAVYNKTERKDYMDYYNVFTAHLAYFIYKKDIKSFGYEKEYRELLDYVKRKKKNG